jgi:hypothetical protein
MRVFINYLTISKGGLRMKKIFPVMLCISFCLAVAFVLPNAGKTNEYVSGPCETCHSSDNQHERHPDLYGQQNCTPCHVDGTFVDESVPSSSCIVSACHDTTTCELAVDHDGYSDPSCTSSACHIECKEDGETTTTTTAATGPCPAEAIYGEYSEEAELLRDYRDNVLSKTQEGQKLIELYYKMSPGIVAAMEKNEKFREIVKKRIDAILPLVKAELAMQ